MTSKVKNHFSGLDFDMISWFCQVSVMTMFMAIAMAMAIAIVMAMAMAMAMAVAVAAAASRGPSRAWENVKYFLGF